MAKKRGRGRPPKPPDEAKQALFQMRLTEDVKERYRLAAERAGVSMSEWIRDRLDKAAAKELR